MAIAAACAPARTGGPDGGEVRILLDQAPLTLNPRMTLDAAGQRLGALVFRALTRIDTELEPVPDLAERWEVSEGGKKWVFRVRAGQSDQGGRPIDARTIAECLGQYRNGKPPALVAISARNWKSVRAKGDRVVFRLESPDPYLARSLSLYRYFTSDGGVCAEPRELASLVGSGPYRPERWDPARGSELGLEPVVPGKRLRFLLVRDENTRLMKLVRGKADAVQNGLSVTKTRWLASRHGDRFALIERDGVNVAYLAFNLRDPLLARKAVRQAIAAAIPREEIVRHKLAGFAEVTGSLVSPRLPESHGAAIPYDPARAEGLLDAEGLRRAAGGRRFTLRFKTTPVREGLETALVIQEALGRIGIDVILDVVEPAVFLSSVRKGAFQLYASRWVGVADGSILFRTLRSGQPNNRARYEDPEMDRVLDRAMAEPEIARRAAILRRAQEKMAEDLPYVPLWIWTNALVVRKELAEGIEPRSLSLSGALEPLTRLKGFR